MRGSLPVLALLALGACAPVGERAAPQPGGPAATRVIQGDYRVTLMDGREYFRTLSSSLSLTGSTFSSQAPCNVVTGQIAPDGAVRAFSGIAVTEMMCNAGLMAFEGRWLEILTTTARIEPDGTAIRLLRADGVEMARLEPARP